MAERMTACASGHYHSPGGAGISPVDRAAWTAKRTSLTLVALATGVAFGDDVGHRARRPFSIAVRF
jgi:hypothetical protein